MNDKNVLNKTMKKCNSTVSTDYNFYTRRHCKRYITLCDSDGPANDVCLAMNEQLSRYFLTTYG